MKPVMWWVIVASVHETGAVGGQRGSCARNGGCGRLWQDVCVKR